MIFFSISLGSEEGRLPSLMDRDDITDIFGETFRFSCKSFKSFIRKVATMQKKRMIQEKEKNASRGSQQEN